MFSAYLGLSFLCIAEEGARIPFRLGFRDINQVSGKYWSNDNVFDKGEGTVQDF